MAFTIEGDLLTLTRGWPDRERGPLVLDLTWTKSRVSQRLICVAARLATFLQEETPLVPDFTGPLLGTDELVPLHSSDWRLPLAKIIAEEREFVAETIDMALSGDLGHEALGGISAGAWEAFASAIAAPTPRVSEESSQETLEEVARVYNTASALGQPPVQAVASRFVISPSAARGRVARARAAGFLPPNPGRGRKSSAPGDTSVEES